ncbi:Domain of unknown function DUF262 [Fimbriimonadaceae bacterium]
MYQNDELIIDPDYQRLFRWSDEKQSQFIESLLLELPVPPLFLIQRSDETYELADGLQRLSTYLRFTGVFEQKPPQGQELLDRIKDPLLITECDIVPDLNGLSYQTLPPALAIRLRRSRIDCAVVKLGSDLRLRYYIFKRLNSGGEKLSEQEARSGFTRMLNPEAVEFIVRLSQNSHFVRTVASITENQRERRFDQELALRFLALLTQPDKFKHDIEPFLTEFLESLANKEHDFDDLNNIFVETFKVLDQAVGEFAFTLAGKQQFSVLHFEGVSVAAARLLGESRLDIPNLNKKLLSLKDDDQFRRYAVGGGKNSNAQFNKRVSIAMEFLRI